MGLVATVRTQNKAEVITALADGGIEQQLDTLQGVRSIAVLDKLISAEGELAFPSPSAAVLDIAGTATAQEVRLLSGKAVVKGEVRVQCAWRAEQETELQSLSTTLPFQQVLDVDGLTEDCKCLCVVEPVGFSLTEGQPDAAGTLSASLMLHLRAWRSYQLQYAADAFSTRFETELVPQELAAEELVCLLNATTTVSGSGPLPDAGAQLRACFVSYGPVSISQQSGQGGGWALTARATATAFAENSLGELDSYEKTLELSVPIPAEVPAGMQLQPECWLSTDSVQCTCTGGTLTVTITARAEGAILGRSTRQGIGSISLGEALTPADPEITLRIYYAQEGEALFDIARRFHGAAGPDAGGQRTGPRHPGADAGTAFSGAGPLTPKAQTLLFPEWCLCFLYARTSDPAK